MEKKRLADFKIIGFILPILLILLWEISSSTNQVDSKILPSPSNLWQVLKVVAVDGTLKKHILKSLGRVIWGYFIGASCGVFMGILLGLSPLLKRIFSVLLEVLRPIPILAWVPVLIVFVGIGEPSKVLAISIGSFWSIFLNTLDGIFNVDVKYKEVGHMYNKSKLEVVLYILIPAALPSIFTGLRIGIGSAWLSVIGSEMIAASSGLGYYITYNREMMKTPQMYVGVITIGVIGWIINIIIRNIERKVLHWNMKGK